jgi:hypothetical protein
MKWPPKHVKRYEYLEGTRLVSKWKWRCQSSSVNVLMERRKSGADQRERFLAPRACDEKYASAEIGTPEHGPVQLSVPFTSFFLINSTTILTVDIMYPFRG